MARVSKAVKREVVECAAFNHAWESAAMNPAYRALHGRCVFLLCVRCGSEKAIDIDSRGVMSRSPIYYYSDLYREFLDSEDAGYSKAYYRNIVYGMRPRHLNSVAS
jgi:hypothetical protein